MPFALGDLVWARVQGHPRWPGQVSDASRANKEARAARRAGSTTLVAFFGDGSFGWFTDAELQPFAPHYDALKKGGRTQASARHDACARRAAMCCTLLDAPQSQLFTLAARYLCAGVRASCDRRQDNA
jgi:DNA (cytosine-5)-methyltransferase 3A